MPLKINNPADYKVAMYIRLSKEDEDKKEESESVTNQRSLINGFIKENRLNLIEIYIDDGISGTTFNRPSFNRLVEDINNKKINMVITKDLSRLGRDYIQTGYYLEKFFPEKRVRYISLLDGIDTGTESSTNDITPFRAIMNDMYAKDISKKITSVKRDKQQKGLFIGGKPAYGYKMHPTEKNKIVIDEVAALNVKRAFNLALEGVSARKIAEKFTDENIPTPSQYANAVYTNTPISHFWKSEFIMTMLRNEVYIGNMVQGRRRKINYKSKKEIRIPKNQWIVVENTHEPIVEKDIFYNVQHILDKRTPIREKKYDYLLKGLVYCYECGYLMAVANRHLASGDTLYFRCRTHLRNTKYSKCSCHSIREDVVNKVVIDCVNNICKQYINKENMLKIYRKEKSKIQEKNYNEITLNELNDEMQKINNSLDKIYDDKLKGILEEKDFERIYINKKKERETIEKQLYEFKRKINKNQNNQNSDEKEFEELLKQFCDLKNPSKLLIFSLIDRVEITRESKIIVKFKFKKLENTK